MPVMNGVESFLEIRKLRPNAKVIMMSGYDEGLVTRAVDNGALGFLHKPFRITELLSKLAEATKATQPVVLVVDDEKDVAKTIAGMLEGGGYKASVASTGAEAIAAVRAGGIDALILDIRMPVLNGLQVYASLKDQGTPPPTIVVSGYADNDREIAHALHVLQVDAFLPKPLRT
jgi:CheY-like chemotaxis protein